MPPAELEGANLAWLSCCCLLLIHYLPLRGAAADVTPLNIHVHEDPKNVTINHRQPSLSICFLSFLSLASASLSSLFLSPSPLLPPAWQFVYFFISLLSFNSRSSPFEPSSSSFIRFLLPLLSISSLITPFARLLHFQCLRPHYFSLYFLMFHANGVCLRNMFVIQQHPFDLHTFI